MSIVSEGAVSPTITAAPIRKQVLPNAVFATLVFVITEIMFFVALMSAYQVIKSRFGAWAPPEGIVLPVMQTGVNSLVLFSSALFLYFAGRAKSKDAQVSVYAGHYLKSIILATIFVSVQGLEWWRLLTAGLAFRTEIFGSVFYLIIGLHALHAVSAIVLMFFQYLTVKSGKVKLENIQAMQVYWYFIVGVWPLLYFTMYFP